MKLRVEACSAEEGEPRWWWVDGCGHTSPDRDFPSWHEAMDHALTCGHNRTDNGTVVPRSEREDAP